jgi:hypothetical protein
MTENYKKYCSLLLKLHACGLESEEGDKVRDEMDFVWYKLTSEEQDKSREFSAELNKKSDV